MTAPSSPIPASPIVVRQCHGLDELGACVELQKEVWGWSESETVPRRVFVLALKIGGQVMGAFDPSRAKTGREESAGLVGFAVALPGFHPGVPYLHSHMLAVRAEYRNQGIGRRLKLLQREDALARGIPRMEWTFDPLEIKNSFFNIAKLGVIARRYYPNLYGVSSSRLQGAIPTDRLCAEWWMESPRVRSVLEGAPAAIPRVEQTIELSREVPEGRRSHERREYVLQVQRANRQRFEHAFATGLAVIGFQRNARGDGVFQLGRWEEPVASESHSQPDLAGVHED